MYLAVPGTIRSVNLKTHTNGKGEPEREIIVTVGIKVPVVVDEAPGEDGAAYTMGQLTRLSIKPMHIAFATDQVELAGLKE